MEESTNSLPNTSSKAIHTSNIIQIEQVVFRNAYVYIRTCMHVIKINLKRPWMWTRAKRSIWEGLGEEKRKGKCGNYVIISKSNRVQNF